MLYRYFLALALLIIIVVQKTLVSIQGDNKSRVATKRKGFSLKYFMF